MEPPRSLRSLPPKGAVRIGSDVILASLTLGGPAGGSASRF